MARRRYVSTEISVDPRVSDLALEGGPYAALLYTWLIPHADDRGAVPSDPRQIKLQVVPGLDHCDVQTIAEAIDAMLRLGLLIDDCGVLRFPESFYKHQSYIKDDRRRSAQNAAIPRNAPTPAQNAASFSSSFSSSFPVSSSEDENLEGEIPPSGAAVAASQRKKPVLVQVPLVNLSEDARTVLQCWRSAHGKRSPPKLNPTQASTLEAALLDLGLARLTEAVTYMASKGVSELSKAISAAKSKRTIDENGSNGHGENRQYPGRAGSGTGRADAGPGASGAGEDDPFAKYVIRDPVPSGDPGGP